jgi:branched-subunit amino acid aminotransferase/4-amino-4-deoxychorismate lyase
LHESVVYNGKILKVGDANLPAASAAAFYGRGVFTTLAIYNRQPFLLSEHSRRLRAHAAKINLDLAEISSFEETLFDLIDENKIEIGRARITLFEASGGALWNFPSERKTSVLITTADRKETINDLILNVSPFLVNSASPLVGVKSCNYLENLLALETAKAQGCSEAVRLNERGETVSACLANLFWIKNRRVFTSGLETGALAGTTRNLIFDLAKNLNLQISETAAGTDALRAADEIFLTSAGIEIRSARKFNDKFYQNDITRKLQKVFFDFIN